MKKNVLDQINEILPQGSILLHEPLKNHTTFRIGGTADCMLNIDTVEQLKEIIPLLKENGEAFFLLGNGSNLLVSDDGYRGTIVHLTGECADCKVQGTTVIVGAGALLSSTARTAAEEGLTGMEFAAGIPGTVGGAIVMNAGAYGGEMCQIVKDVTVLTPEGELLVIAGEEMNFGYRTSKVKNTDLIVVAVTIELSYGEKESIISKMKELADKRREKQPLEYPSAGSTFKRPEGYFAGKLIMDCGLRGYQIGGAQVAEKHCGFVINRQDATAKDVKELMDYICDKVLTETGVTLEKEIIFLGDI